MILFLEFSSKGHRGGEVYHQHLFKFLKDNYPSVQPDSLRMLPEHIVSRRARVKYACVLVDKFNPELIVSDISSAALNFAAISRAKKRGANLLLIVQGERDLSSTKSWMRKKFICWAERYVVGKADFLLANSKYSADRIKTKFKKEIQTVVAYPGLVVNRSTDRKVDKENDRTKLLFVGECSRVKGLIFLIRAIAKLENIKFTLDIAGGWSQEPEYYKDVCDLIKSYNLEDKIKWHGFVDTDSLSDLYINSDILVAPSLSEGYGMVVAEAVIYQLPVIASSVGGIQEIIGDSNAGLLVPHSDVDALVKGITSISIDSLLREKMRKSAIERAASLPGWDDFHLSLETELKRLLKPINNLS